MYQIVFLPHFKKQLKPFAKKYNNFKEDLLFVLKNFNKEHSQHIGKVMYKIRFKPKSFSKGKSGAFRVILLLVEVEKDIVPVHVYFKGEKSNVKEGELVVHLNKILLELRSIKQIDESGL